LYRHVVVLVVVAACSSRTPSPDAGVKSPVLATFGTHAITEADLQARIDEEPPVLRAAYSSPERKKELITSMMRTTLLVDEAKRRGLDSTPEFRRLVERVLVQQLTQQLSAESKLSDDVVRKYFDEHPDEFRRPERLRVAQVLFGAPVGDAAKRKAARDEAAQARAKLLKVKPAEQSVAFSTLAQARSTHEESRTQGGDLGLRTRAELDQVWGTGVGEAVGALKQPGDVSPVVESDRGFHLLRLVGRQPESVTTFDDAKAGIRLRLEAGARATALGELSAKLEQASPVVTK
jgi:parvulin-like peptidyl-prolyl isomerase